MYSHIQDVMADTKVSVVYITYVPRGSKFAAIKVCTPEEVSNIEHNFGLSTEEAIAYIKMKCEIGAL